MTREKTIIERLRSKEGRGGRENMSPVSHTIPFPADQVYDTTKHDQSAPHHPYAPKRNAVPTSPQVMTGTNLADAKPRIWKSGASQVEDK